MVGASIDSLSVTLTDLAAQLDDDDPASWTAEQVQRARGGDKDAFAAIVERYQGMVLRTALRLLGRIDLAQDASQEAFLRLHRHLGRFDPARQLAPWLYRIVVNAARDMGRRAGREPTVALAELHESDHPALRVEPEAIEAEAGRAEERQRLQAALLRLPRKERAAIVLRDVEGLTTAEVAEVLGSTQGTVRSQICTARLKLRRFLTEAETKETRS